MCCPDTPQHATDSSGALIKNPDQDFNEQPKTFYEVNPFTDTFQGAFQNLLGGASKYAPLEDRVIAMRERFGSPAYQQEQINQAKADVSKAFADQRALSDAQAASMGLDPTNPRRRALNRGMDIAQAGATAGAGTMARRAAERQDFDTLAALSTRGDVKTEQAIKAGSMGGDLYMKGQALNADIFKQGRALDWENFLRWRDLQAKKDASDEASDNAGWGGIGSAIGTIGSIALPFLLPSSRTLKTDIRPYRGGREAVRSLPVNRWRYKEGVADEAEHIGTFAEDFADVTGKGDGKTIPVVDAIGVTMAAVKDLDRAVRRLERKL